MRCAKISVSGQPPSQAGHGLAKFQNTLARASIPTFAVSTLGFSTSRSLLQVAARRTQHSPNLRLGQLFSPPIADCLLLEISTLSSLQSLASPWRSCIGAPRRLAILVPIDRLRAFAQRCSAAAAMSKRHSGQLKHMGIFEQAQRLGASSGLGNLDQMCVVHRTRRVCTTQKRSRFADAPHGSQSIATIRQASARLAGSFW